MTLRTTTRRVLIGLVPAATVAAVLAQTPALTLNIKPGLWENTTVTTSSANGTSMPAQTRVNKSCMTPAKIAQGTTGQPPPQMGADCKTQVTHQDAASLDTKMSCTLAQMPNQQFSGTTHVDVVSPESMKATTTISMTGAMAMSTNVVITSKWVGADCGDIK
jgi:hypothetical protein